MHLGRSLTDSMVGVDLKADISSVARNILSGQQIGRGGQD